MDIIELFQRLGVAVAIGFFVGVERGWKQRDMKDETRVAGLRTYTLIGLLGGIAGRLGQTVDPSAFAAIAAVFGIAWIAYKLWETWLDSDISVTGVIAGLLVFSLGAYASIGSLELAAAAGVFTVGVLAFKEALHNWVETLTWPEIRSALIILAATLIALPLLPARALDPLGLFNPREIWLLSIVIAGASFAGYVALRVLGPKAGLYLGAAVGALVSSTVVTLDLARRAKAKEAAPMQAAAAATLANLVMLARVGVLIGIFAAPALLAALPALIAAGVVSLGAVAFMAFAPHRNDGESRAALQSPLDLKSVVAFALLLAFVTAATKIVTEMFGDAGLIAFAATAGLMDVDAVSLAVGGMARGGLDLHAAAEAILVAAAANTCTKLAIAGGAGGGRFAVFYLSAGIASLAAGAAAFFLIDITGMDFGALGGS